MKPVKFTLVLIAMLVATVASGLALARGHGGHSGGGHYRGGHYAGGHYGGSRAGIGVFIGAPLLGFYSSPHYYYPPTYYAPGYYYPPAVAVPYSPPAYIEQGYAQPAPAQPQANWWYYCPGTESYYPYVQECAGGWQRVAPQPPPG